MRSNPCDPQAGRYDEDHRDGSVERRADGKGDERRSGLLSGEAVFNQRSDRTDERADERAGRRRRRKGVREREEKAADIGREDQRHIHLDRDTAAHQGIRVFERRDQTDGREAVHHQQRDEGIISEHSEEV